MTCCVRELPASRPSMWARRGARAGATGEAPSPPRRPWQRRRAVSPACPLELCADGAVGRPGGAPSGALPDSMLLGGGMHLGNTAMAHQTTRLRALAQHDAPIRASGGANPQTRSAHPVSCACRGCANGNRVVAQHIGAMPARVCQSMAEASYGRVAAHIMTTGMWFMARTSSVCESLVMTTGARECARMWSQPEWVRRLLQALRLLR